MLKKQLPYALWSLGAACALVWGFLLERNRDLSMSDARMYAAIAAAAVAFFALCQGLCWAVNRFSRPVEAAPVAPCSVRFTIVLGAILLCGWIPILLASWPGYFCYDVNHAVMYANEGSLIDQQPLLHSIACGSILRMGNMLLGSWNGAVALYTCLQLCVLLALALLTLRCLSTLGFSAKMLVGCAIFYAINPAVALLSVCSSKDVLFGFCLTFLCVLLVRVLRYGESLKHITRDCVLVGTLLFVVLVYRGNVFYAFIALMPFAVLFLHRLDGRVTIRLLVTSATALVCVFVWNGPVTNALGTARSNSMREMISIPAVEIARCARFDNWGEDEFERLGLDRTFISDLYSAGSYHSSDNVRVAFWPIVDEGKTGDLIRLWLLARRSHFSQCMVADLELTEAAWYVGATEDGYNLLHVKDYEYDSTLSSTFAAWCESPARQESLLPWLSDAVWHISRYDTMAEQPLLHPLLSVACYLWLFLLVLARGFEKNDVAIKTVGVFLLLITGTMFLGPMVLLRYYYYLVLLAPLLLGLVFLRPQEERVGKHFA